MEIKSLKSNICRGSFKHVFFFATIIFLSYSSMSNASTMNSNLMNAGGDTLKNGLVGWWTLDGADIVNNVVDRSGTGNTGYLKNFTSTSTAKVSGKLGQALQLDGVDDYVLVGNPSNLNFGTNSFSYGLWVYVTTTVGQYDAPMAKGGASTSFPGFDIELGSGIWATNLTDTLIVKTKNFTTSPILGRWAYLFSTVDRSSNRLCTFVDGVQTSGACADISTLGTVSGTSNLVFGRNSNAATIQFKGKIDDIRIYNRVLSSQEIKSLYNLGADKINSNLMNAGGNTLKNGLVGWWTLDGADIVNNVVDRSGTGNTGYLKNFTSTSTAKVSGKLGQSLKFDGVDDYVLIGNPSNLNFGTNSFSYGLWVYVTGLTSSWDEPIGKGGGGVSVPGFDMELGLSTWTANVTDDSVIKQKIFSSDPIVNQWVHLFVTVDRSNNSLCAFLNGNKVTTCTDISTIVGSISGSSNLTIGRSSSGFYPFKGKIDDIRIYSRALSAQEIKSLYNLGADKINSNLMNAGGNTLKNGLVGWWTLDGADIVNNVVDRSGTGNTGYMLNMATGTAKISGKLGQALQFDGVDDYVIGKNIVNTAKTTISAWIKIDIVPSQNGLIAGFINGIGSITHDKNLYIGTDGKLYFYVYDVGPKTTSVPSAAIPLKTWVHVAGVADGSSAKTYINGLEVGTIPAGDSYSSYNVPDIVIGGATGNIPVGGGYFKQKVDDVRIYNRALTPFEIKQLYNLGR